MTLFWIYLLYFEYDKCIASHFSPQSILYTSDNHLNIGSVTVANYGSRRLRNQLFWASYGQFHIIACHTPYLNLPIWHSAYMQSVILALWHMHFAYSMAALHRAAETLGAQALLTCRLRLLFDVQKFWQNICHTYIYSK